MNNSLTPPYRIAPGGARFVQINGAWINTEAIESIEKPDGKPVTLQMISGSSIPVHGIFSVDTFANGILGRRNDQPIGG